VDEKSNGNLGSRRRGVDTNESTWLLGWGLRRGRRREVVAAAVVCSLGIHVSVDCQR
jgi:hypothetical protein